MAFSQEQILSDMLAALKLAEPTLDTGIGSLVRKIYDPVAEALAERDVDAYLHRYAYDIDSKSGADLDEMCRLFGFTRYPARRSKGELAFSRTDPSPTAPPILIPAGTQVMTGDETIVATVTTAVLMPGDLNVWVPALAVEPGLEGNVAPYTLTIMVNQVPGITGCTNPSAFTDGADAENDAHLRQRFRDTVFRSLAGTESMFLGIALDNPRVTHANVVGSTKIHRERLKLAGGTATSTITDAAYIVPESAIVGANLQGQEVLREGAHYSFNYGVNPPVITSLSGSAMGDDIFDVEFEYVPRASRNDLANGISNRVDIYVRGTDAIEATETGVFSTSRTFSASPTSSLHSEKFQRRDESHPSVGNFFVPYSMVPIVTPSMNDQIVINAVTYEEGVHYWHVRDITAKGGSPRSLEGIEIRSSANGSPLDDPPDNATFPVTYTFNAVPRDIETAIGDQWRITNQDVWVHEGKLRRLNVNLAVMLDRGYTQGQVEADIYRALSTHLDNVGFNRVLQAADLLAVASQVSGVDAVRYLTDADDGVRYAIQRVNVNNNIMETYATATTPMRPLDITFGDDHVPVLNEVHVVVTAQNTWGSA